MKKRPLFPIITLSIMSPGVTYAALTWVSTSNTDFGTEANWLDTVSSAPPTAGTLENNTVVGNDLVIDAVSVTIVVPQSYRVLPGDGQTITVTDSTVTGEFDTTYHPISVGGGGSINIVLNGATDFAYGWSWDTAWTLNGTSQLTAKNPNSNANGGVLGRTSTLNFASLDTEFSLELIDYTSDSLDRTRFISKLSVLGQPAVIGENLLITSDGGSGTIFTPIPEQSTALLGFLGTLGLFRRQR